MSLPWFRMYTDFLTDWRIESLAFEDQRHYVFLLCCKCAGVLDETYPNAAVRDRSLSKRMGLQGDAFDAAKARLIEVGLIDENWQPLAWEKRQRASDNVAERMRKYRKTKKKKKRYVTQDVTKANGDGNELPESDGIDTDTDTDKEIGSTNVDPLVWTEFVAHRKAIRKPLGKLSAEKNLNILAAMSPADQRRAVDATIANNWTGIFPPKGNANGTHNGHAAPRSAVDRVRAAAAARAAADPDY